MDRNKLRLLPLMIGMDLSSLRKRFKHSESSNSSGISEQFVMVCCFYTLLPVHFVPLDFRLCLVMLRDCSSALFINRPTSIIVFFQPLFLLDCHVCFVLVVCIAVKWMKVCGLFPFSMLLFKKRIIKNTLKKIKKYRLKKYLVRFSFYLYL